MENFLWHKVSEKEKKEISKKAKAIMDNFSNALTKAPEIKPSFIERKQSTRQEGEEGESVDADFRKIMFQNAPNKDKECIKAEKGGWT